MRYKLKEELDFRRTSDFIIDDVPISIKDSAYVLTDIGDQFLVTGYLRGSHIEYFSVLSKDFLKSSNWVKTVGAALLAHQFMESPAMANARLHLWVSSKDNVVLIDELVNNSKHVQLIKDTDGEWYLVGLN